MGTRQPATELIIIRTPQVMEHSAEGVPCRIRLSLSAGATRVTATSLLTSASYKDLGEKAEPQVVTRLWTKWWQVARQQLAKRRCSDFPREEAACSWIGQISTRLFALAKQPLEP